MFSHKSLRSGAFSLRMPCCLTVSMVLLVVVAMEPASTGQNAGAGSQSVVEAGNGILDSGIGFPSIFPVALPRNLVSRFSLEQAYESGIRNGKYANGSDALTEASVSFVYKVS